MKICSCHWWQFEGDQKNILPQSFTCENVFCGVLFLCNWVNISLGTLLLPHIIRNEDEISTITQRPKADRSKILDLQEKENQYGESQVTLEKSFIPKRERPNQWRWEDKSIVKSQHQSKVSNKTYLYYTSCKNVGHYHRLSIFQSSSTFFTN